MPIKSRAPAAMTSLPRAAGNDKLSGDGGNDVFILAGNFTAADQIDGGADYDILKLQGNYSTAVALAATTLMNVEEINLAAGSSYKLISMTPTTRPA